MTTDGFAFDRASWLSRLNLAVDPPGAVPSEDAFREEIDALHALRPYLLRVGYRAPDPDERDLLGLRAWPPSRYQPQPWCILVVDGRPTGWHYARLRRADGEPAFLVESAPVRLVLSDERTARRVLVMLYDAATGAFGDPPEPVAQDRPDGVRIFVQGGFSRPSGTPSRDSLPDPFRPVPAATLVVVSGSRVRSVRRLAADGHVEPERAAFVPCPPGRDPEAPLLSVPLTAARRSALLAAR